VSTKRVDPATGRASGSPAGERQHDCRFRSLGCADEEEVLVTQGSVAAAYFEGVKAPVDALIIGSVDERG